MPDQTARPPAACDRDRAGPRRDCSERIPTRVVVACSDSVDIFRVGDRTFKAMAARSPRRARRQFTDAFNASAERLVRDEGQSVGTAARDLVLTATALRKWVTRARADRMRGRTGLTIAEREELTRLRKENRVLQEERGILTIAAALFAKQSRSGSGSSRRRRPSTP